MTTPTPFAADPDRIRRPDVAVMERATGDTLPEIRQLWPVFEAIVGLRGRKMFARADEASKTYTVCTPPRDGDDAQALGLDVGVLPGGEYLRARLEGAPDEIFARIGAGMTELIAAAGAARDHGRPLIEYYARHNMVELWVPVTG